MAYTVHFPTSGPILSIEAIADWLAANAEAADREGPHTLALRAVPMRVVVAPDAAVKADVDVTSSVKLDRVVSLVFTLALELGSDVRLSDTGKLTRGQLWLRLADEQDRRRIGEALEKADVHGRRDEVMRGLWALLSSLREGDDIRWDVGRQAAVRLVEIGEEGGISLEDAAWHCEEPREGDTVALPVVGDVHILAWRWLAEAWPALAGT